MHSKLLIVFLCSFVLNSIGMEEIQLRTGVQLQVKYVKEIRERINKVRQESDFAVQEFALLCSMPNYVVTGSKTKRLLTTYKLNHKDPTTRSIIKELLDEESYDFWHDESSD